ncbi:hypothetical protein EHM76_00540 [bacterium]|nr:MAG: hypothetical protein EHM76_00540 [bacterium]
MKAEDMKAEEIAQIFAILKGYGPDLKELLLGMSLAIAENKRSVIATYQEKGFSREDAIMLVQDEWYALARGIRTAIAVRRKGDI